MVVVVVVVNLPTENFAAKLGLFFINWVSIFVPSLVVGDEKKKEREKVREREKEVKGEFFLP